jgi:hypothetical protein
MSDRATMQGREPIVDAHKTVEFEVSDDDVKTGKALKSRECPGNNGVCRALKAVHPSLQNKEVRVYLSRTFIRVPVEVATKEFGAEVPRRETANHVWLRFQNAPELAEQVYKMDREEEFASGTYRLDVPPKPKRPGVKPRTYKFRSKATSKKSPRSLKGVRKWGAAR